MSEQRMSDQEPERAEIAEPQAEHETAAPDKTEASANVPENMETIGRVRSYFENEYAECMAPLHELSYDAANNRALCKRNERFLSYEKMVIGAYRGNNPRTPDMLLFHQDAMVFVEFKAGRVDIRSNRMRRESLRNDLKLKSIEGCYIALGKLLESADITHENIWRLKKFFVVVYDERRLTNRRISGILAHKESMIMKFGLDIYQGLFFAGVQALSCSNFLKWLERHDFISGSQNHPKRRGGGGSRKKRHP